MKIGIRSDIHFKEDLGNCRPHPKWGTDRLATIVDTVQQSNDKFMEKDVELIIDGSDMFDQKNDISIHCWRAASYSIAYTPAPIATVTSNHGASNRMGDVHAAHVFYLLTYGLEKQGYVNNSRHGTNHFMVLDPFGKTVATKGKGILLFGLPYRKTEDIKLFYNDCKKIQKSYKDDYKGLDWEAVIIVMHQGVREAKLKNAPEKLEKNISAKKLLKAFKWADLIVAGHYHDPQKLSKRFLIPGAICQHNFKDVGGERGFWIYDTKTKKLKFYPTVAPKFHKVDYEDLKEYSGLVKGDFLRVVVQRQAQIEKVSKKYGNKYKVSFTIEPQKNPEELRDPTMTFNLDDVDLLEKYIKHRKVENLKPSTLVKLGKKIIKESNKRK